MLTLSQSISAVRKGDAVANAAVRDATAALVTSLASIQSDGGVVNKSAAAAESVTQFVRYLVRKGVDAETAERAAAGVVAKVGARRKPKSDFHTQSPDEARTRMNTRDAARGTMKPHQTRTKPRAAGEPPPDTDEQLEDAMEELKHRAAALQKADPTLSEAQAFTKAYESNRDLQGRHFQQRMEVVTGQRAGGRIVKLGGGRFERVV
jgi:hypothetical protein